MYKKKLRINGKPFQLEGVIVGGEDPTDETEGNLGQLYYNRNTDTYFKCTFSENGVFSWSEFGTVFFDSVEADQETGLLHFLKDGEDVVDPVYIGNIGGGGGGSGNNAVLTLVNSTDWLAKTISAGADCPVSVTWSSIENETETGPGLLTIRVNNVVKRTMDVSQGLVTVNLKDLLSIGTSKVRITVSDVYENSKSINYTIKAVDLRMTSAFSSAGEFAAGQSVVYTYTPYGSVEKTVHFELDGVEVGTQVVTASGRQQSYNLPAMAHGAHYLRVWFTAQIDGDTVPSNSLYYSFVVVGDSNAVIIASPFTDTEVEQYTTLTIPYRVYTPGSLMSSVSLYNGQTKISDLTVDRTEQTLSFRADAYGEITLRIVSGGVEADIIITVTESDIHADPEEDSLALHLSSAGRSNNEDHPEIWADAERNISCTLTGFNFVSNGWVKDSDGNTALRVNHGARVTIPYKPFRTDFRATGKTIEIEFAARDVLNYDAALVSCWVGNRGFKLTSQFVTLKSESSEIVTQFKEDEHVRVSVVVEKSTENRLIYMYINGVMSGAVQYPAADDFSQPSPVNISIGSDDCTTDIYSIRVYDNNLTRYQIVNNWIADTQDVALMLARYAHNDIYDEYGKVVIEKLPDDLPYMIVECPELPQYKGDKKTASVRYVDPVNPARSFTAEGVQMNVQGTSSAPYARKNYDMQYKSGFVLAGGTTSQNYELAPGTIPFNRFVMKADVASSEGANNVELVKLFCDADPYKRPEELANAKVRKGIYGFPCVIFWHNPDDDSETLLGKYNFNFPKRAPGPYGYTGNMESWEFQNNTSDLMLFKTDYFDETMRVDADTGDMKEAWRFDYEARFPEDTWTDYSKLQELHTFIISTYREQATGDELDEPYTDVDGNTHTVDNAAYRLAKFRSEFSRYAEVDSFLFYYIFTELFLMVDSRAKNLFIGFSGGNASGLTVIDRKAVAEPYDMDTAIGTNNEGSLVFGYSLEDTDHLTGGADVFNGQESVLWNNIRDAFPVEIAQMYQRLRSQGVLSYANVEKRFEDHQAKWPEALFNEDAQFKYLDPLINPDPGKQPTDVYLPMLQGSKAEQRKWWLYNRFRYMDSKWNAGDALTDVIQLRGYAKDDITVTPYADIYPTVKYGSYTVAVRGQHGVPATLECPLDNVNDTEIYIYSASQLASVGDLSGLKVGFADFSKATKLGVIKVGSSESGYVNPNLTGLSVGRNPLLGTVDARNCTTLTGTVDLSGAPNIEHVYLDGTAVTGCSLPKGGIVKTLHLPGTITNLTVQDQAEITDFVLPDYSNITTLRVENSPAIPVLDILANIPANSRVRIVGLNMTVESTDEVDDLYDLLDTMRGLDEAGNNLDRAVVSGTITGLGSITGAWLASMYARYPNITIGYEHITSNLKYYTFDGSTLLYTESITDGGNGAYAGTPTRAKSGGYQYTFIGWNKSQNQFTADANATKNVTADRNVYAAYSRETAKYTVRFYNGSTLLQTVENVEYGSNATYTGATPVGEEDYLSFTGWEPSNENITDDIDCVAQFADLRSDLRKYLEGGLESYSSDTITMIAGYAFIGCTELKSVEASATMVEADAFNGCTALSLVDLSNTAPVTIQASAFNSCSNLAHLIVRSTTVSSLVNANALSGTKIASGFGAIYVPADLVDTYKAATNWSTYSAQIFPISAYPKTDFSTISDSWETILTNPNYATDYSVGDTKLLTVNGVDLYMQIAAFDTDLLEESGTAGITWISRVFLEKKRIDGGSQVSGGWENTELAEYLENTILPAIPAVVRNNIVEVQKTYRSKYPTDETKTAICKLWIPSYREVGFTHSSAVESSGVIYSGLFSSNGARIRYDEDLNMGKWWLRTGASQNKNFEYVMDNGSATSAYSGLTNKYGVVLGFCTNL